MVNVPKLHLFFFRLQTYPDQTFSRNRFPFLSLALRIACWETMMWFWKSSSASGICTVVDMRLQILQRKLDKGAENAVRVWSPWSPCPQQTQMFQPDPDVLIFDLGGILMEEVIPDPGLLNPEWITARTMTRTWRRDNEEGSDWYLACLQKHES